MNMTLRLPDPMAARVDVAKLTGMSRHGMILWLIDDALQRLERKHAGSQAGISVSPEHAAGVAAMEAATDPITTDKPDGAFDDKLMASGQAVVTDEKPPRLLKDTDPSKPSAADIAKAREHVDAGPDGEESVTTEVGRKSLAELKDLPGVQSGADLQKQKAEEVGELPTALERGCSNCTEGGAVIRADCAYAGIYHR